MKSIALVFLITFVPVLCKESLQEFEKFLKDPDFIALAKRLGLDDTDTPSSLGDSSAIPAAASVQPHDSGDSSCSKNYKANTIIQTKISLNKGATFLFSEHDVSDAEHCARRCCETDDCDVSVYQDKEKRACYLFKCKDDITKVNTCEFSNHQGYYTIFVTKSTDGAPSRNSAPDETDLSDLKSSQTQKPASSTAKPSTISYHPHSVGNGGVCVEDLNCEDIHAECRAGTCRCRSGFKETRGQCRRQCGEEEFRCLEPGTAVAGPDCIPRSQFCDGEAQCGDGSDEINCPTTGQTGGAGTGHGDRQHSSGGLGPAKPGSLGAGDTGKSPDSGTSSQTAKPQGDTAQTGAGQGAKDSGAVVTGDSDAAKPEAAQGTSGSDDTDKDTESADGQTASKDDTKGDSNGDSNDSKDDSKDDGKGDNGDSNDSKGDSKGDSKSDSKGDSKSDSKGDSKSDSKGDSKEKESSPDASGPKDSGKGASAAGSTAAPAVARPGLQASQGESAEFVEKMSLIEAYTTKGPIIALSLGLCFTVILLIFVGCRLRNVRRRLRKGRPLHSNEADYLINGMYL